MKRENYLCFAAIGSVTQAMNAQRILSRAAIPTEVIKSEKEGSKRGCIYGVSFSCSQQNNVRTVLNLNKIQVKGWE